MLDVAATVRISSNSCEHDRRAADDAVEAEAILKLGAQVGVFGLQPPLFHRRVQLVQQLFELKRLGDEPLGAEARDLDGFPHRAEPGDDDGDDVRVAREGLVEHLAAVDAGQPEVGDEDVEGELVQPLERLFARARLLDAEPMLAEPLGDGLPKAGFVVNEQKVLTGESAMSLRWRYFDTDRARCEVRGGCRASAKASAGAECGAGAGAGRRAHEASEVREHSAAVVHLARASGPIALASPSRHCSAPRTPHCAPTA